ncbi:MAG TPA: glycine zipper family protein [Candidatus Nitrosotalea sp.]|nr:glycine zipper family protein [Candidatus Nitrosotalea sp.]
MMMRPAVLAPLLTSLLVAACTTVPSGPSVMVLPGTGKSFDQFQVDDIVCRQWAAQQTGITPGQSSVGSTATGAAVGTLVGAAAGAAIGAAAGGPATGAAAGAGVGLLGGTAVGASRGDVSGQATQQQYDMAYMQCMYAKGNQVPVSRGSEPYSSPPPPPAPRAPDVPPPPAGTPPPPPPASPR